MTASVFEHRKQLVVRGGPSISRGSPKVCGGPVLVASYAAQYVGYSLLLISILISILVSILISIRVSFTHAI